MDLKQLKGVYLLGIGGIGMSALARYFRRQGLVVYGYDKVRSPLCEQLEAEGMLIHYEDKKEHFPSVFETHPAQHLIIYTPAIPADAVLYNHIKQLDIPLYKRAEVLGLISQNTYCIAIAGTHGKTTTSALMTKVLHQCGIRFTAFLGGISADFGSNYVENLTGIMPFDQEIMVVEADEFDRSFLHLQPNAAIITSTDADHLDIYGTDDAVKQAFLMFAQNIKKNGYLLQRGGLNLEVGHVQSFSYGDASENVDYQYKPIVKQGEPFAFEWRDLNQNSYLIQPGIDGLHNAENACAVLALANRLGFDVALAIQGVSTFKGIKRRFQKLIDTPTFLVIDDYAHHPTELKALIQSVKNHWPDREITGVFQPHLFSRTQDFMEGFATSLSQLDQCLLLDIYPAREKPIPGVTSEALAAKIEGCIGVFTPENLLDFMQHNQPKTLLLIGAGDIDRLSLPIQKLYETFA